MQSSKISDVTIPLVSRETQLSFNGLTYSASRVKPILDNISGTFRSGRLTAIIGPSGAGKSSLLNALSGLRAKGVHGTILINNEIQDQQQYRRLVTYNTQEVALLPNLTVRETLEYAVDLRTRSSSTKKRKIVQDIITVLALQKCINTQARQLSGGERKRLSIGQDLISNPKIMLFDEPTSGLDSESSYQMVSYLKELTKQDRCVISVIHQPSSDLLELFDDLYVLSDGKCMYSGSLHDLIPWFESVGLVCPQYYNRADFVVKLASTSNPDKSKIYQLMYQMESVNKDKPQALLPSEKNRPKGRQYPTSAFNQFFTLTRRTTLGTIRNFSLSVLRFIGLIIFSLFMGLIYRDIGKDASNIISNTAFINLSLANIVFVNSVAVILSFPTEASVFLREYRANCYSVAAYYCSKLFADFIPMMAGNCCFFAIGYFLTGQPAELERFLGYGLVVLLMGWFAQIYGICSGCVFSIEIGTFLMPSSLLPMLLFGGFFIRFDELSVALKPLVYTSPFGYAFKAIGQALYGNNRTDVGCSEGGECFYTSGEDILKMLDMENVSYWNEVSGLGIIIVVLHVILFICLLIKVK
ncbi:ATP-binding cassette sub-family G member 1 [Culex quinquefasciatus]|nr:ATP-binding cassette sub-family G member 1 [Culex quinquefasciatus]